MSEDLGTFLTKLVCVIHNAPRSKDGSCPLCEKKRREEDKKSR